MARPLSEESPLVQFESHCKRITTWLSLDRYVGVRLKSRS